MSLYVFHFYYLIKFSFYIARMLLEGSERFYFDHEKDFH